MNRLLQIVSATLFLPAFAASQNANDSVVVNGEGEKLELFPILSYDTDAGFGYGGKAFAWNLFRSDESIDVTIFNSTKGERWYRIVFSLPDFERRQGSVYPIALDIVLDYDKWIANSFFGIGNGSQFSEREYYTKEPFDLSASMSRGFTSSIVGQCGARYRFVRNFNFEDGSRLRILVPPQNGSRIAYLSFFLTARYDTRNSYINATDGEVAQVEAETAPSWDVNDVAFFRLAGWLQWYRTILPGLVFAVRGGIAGINGDDLPVQVLLPVGGGSTVRGMPQDRFLDEVSAVSNLELRFPIFWRLGGVVGADAGRVWHRMRETRFAGWETNALLGLRFMMDTFIVRLDVGIGHEATGLFLNFGQLF